ncbi:MAG: putative Ig domain-containing protein, partial [Verrucomicrobia bacterium]|nr:putative Ig domain-containing protein [Verrucomicrobiota bacterium]
MNINKRVRLRAMVPKLAGWLSLFLLAEGTFAASPTVVRVVNTFIPSSQPGTVVIEMDATGEESALGFSLNFDPSRLTFGDVVLGGGATAATLNKNTLQASAGRIGVVVGMPPGQGFAAGRVELLRFTFTAGVVSGETPLTFGDVPVFREVASRQATPLAATFTGGTVRVGNNAPQLSTIPNQTVTEGSTLNIPVIATDPDLPRDTLAFSLEAGAPTGASIEAGTGVFSWTPSEAQGPGTATITVRVSDNGIPQLSATQ